MKILILGSGGREHALSWKIAQSPLVDQLYCAPGNPGMSAHGTLVSMDINNPSVVLEFCQSHDITFVVIGPEAPLVNGVADLLRAHDILVLGPSQKAAQLEGSKGFAKDFLKRHHINTAAYQRFYTLKEAQNYIETQAFPLVIKADGLAAGKGVIIASCKEEALEALEKCFSGAFGVHQASVVIEDFLEGEEISFFCLCDGNIAVPFGSAQDHKRVGDHDTGPNTGGMGAYAPSYLVNKVLEKEILETIAQPTVTAMKKEGMPFIGILFLGLMLTKNGPYVIEYNVRFGDPECQTLMTLFDGDILPFFLEAAQGALKLSSAPWKKQHALTVVFAAKGYPEAPEKGTIIQGLEKITPVDDVQIFHAGTAIKDGQLVAHGGRVLNITATGQTVQEAQKRAYQTIAKINWPGGFFRHDIGWRAIAYERKHAIKIPS